ncbi:MAG: hypothetical protein JRH07_11625 [Deltaproteobacteria bacterium]|nr:hypothetical protein [Deltaproteobacteria bacterium]MBW2122482.1 hypothetical protein [Deltaproteobacteria bacterium]
MIEEHDGKGIRCPRLGGEVTFKFCRTMNDHLPCGWIARCWRGQLDIEKFLADHYSPQELDRVFTPPKSKLETLVELVEKAKKREKESQ